ncbi:MAG: hypothetical protein EXS04_05660 [Phycisphaerales bacterium]|nr:hypothetical protein [Phycisphaerales bacterium]
MASEEGTDVWRQAGGVGGEIDAHIAGNHAALEQLFRMRVIAFLVEAGFLPLDRARMLQL